MTTFRPIDRAEVNLYDRSLAGQYLYALSRFEGYHEYPYCWGYTIFRTVYGPGSNEAFSKAIERLNAWIKYVLETNARSPKIPEIWNRYYNEIIEDETLGNASIEEVGRRFDTWVAEHLHLPSDYPGSEAPNSRFRFCIMLDQEGIDKILSLPEHLSHDGLYHPATQDPWIKVITTWDSWQFEGCRVWIKHRIFDDLSATWFGGTDPDAFSEESIWEAEDHGRIDIRDAGGF